MLDTFRVLKFQNSAPTLYAQDFGSLSHFGPDGETARIAIVSFYGSLTGIEKLEAEMLQQIDRQPNPENLKMYFGVLLDSYDRQWTRLQKTSGAVAKVRQKIKAGK
jgi:hypothetical protein